MLNQPPEKVLPNGSKLIVRSRCKLQLGPMCLELCSNEADFEGLRHFPLSTRLTEDAAAAFCVNLCNLNADGPWQPEAIRSFQDRSYRAGRFTQGYYITDHFGPPAHIATFGQDIWIFAQRFEQILWPYVVKYLLTIYSIDQGLLHLKAAAVSLNGAGTLLVARGGGGKTVLLTNLCQAGALFLSNTHVLLNASEIVAVPTAMRVRDDRLFGPVIRARALPPAIKPGEYTADPMADLGWSGGTTAPAANICLVDYRPDNEIIQSLQPSVLFDYMEQFSLALNVYGLKEDVLDYLHSDVSAFSTQTDLMRLRLRSLIAACRTYYVSCDSTRPEILQRLCEQLTRN